MMNTAFPTLDSLYFSGGSPPPPPFLFDPTTQKVQQVVQLTGRRKRKSTEKMSSLDSNKRVLIASPKFGWSLKEINLLRWASQGMDSKNFSGKRVLELAPELALTRNSKQIRERFLEHEAPDLLRKEEVTEEVEQRLLELHRQYGRKWSLISKQSEDPVTHKVASQGTVKNLFYQKWSKLPAFPSPASIAHLNPTPPVNTNDDEDDLEVEQEALLGEIAGDPDFLLEDTDSLGSFIMDPTATLNLELEDPFEEQTSIQRLSQIEEDASSEDHFDIEDLADLIG